MRGESGRQERKSRGAVWRILEITSDRVWSARSGLAWLTDCPLSDLGDCRRLFGKALVSCEPAHGVPHHAYWITSSARTSREGGIVIPSALAVLRLMTSSNVVACSTGRSAGL